MRLWQTNSAPAESGTAGAELLPIVFLLLLPLVILFVNTWLVINTKLVATDAARLATRVAVESMNLAEARRAAQLSVERSSGRTRTAGPVSVSMSATNGYLRCSRIDVTVQIPVKLTLIRFGPNAARLMVTSHQSEIVDPHRSGLGGQGVCVL